VSTRLFVGCTPRTGNLWFRRLLAGALGIPEYAAHEPEEIAWQDLPPGCIVAMHAHATPAFRQFLADGEFRVLVTTRHPLDVLISILQFSKREPTTAQWLNREGGDETSLAQAGPLDKAFLDYCLSERAAALLSVSPQWLPFADAIGRYEQLVAQPEDELSNVFERLGIAPAQPLRDVIKENRIDHLRELLAPHSQHFWRGEPGLWRKLLPAEVAVPIATRHETVFEQLGYVCDYDPTLRREHALQNWERLCRPEAPEAPAKPRRWWHSLFRRQPG
jgi:hypothetical protein